MGCQVIIYLLPYLLLAILTAPDFCGQALAQSSSSSLSKPRESSQSTSNARIDPGFVKAGIYRNSAFGFSCKIPAGWVLRTDEMNAPADQTDRSAAEHSKTSNRVLLAAFSRPPQARSPGVNQSILIAAESASAYPGLKDAAQYFGPITEVATSQGFEIDEDPYEFLAATTKLVRADYERDIGTRVMRQSTLVMLSRGYAVSFTFIAGTDDEVEELIAGLSFAASAKPPHR